MRPLFNSIPFQSNPTQPNGTNASAAQQVNLPPNQCQGNPGKFLPNSAQFQSQMGMMNPQIAIPFNNSSGHLSNSAMAMPNGFLNAPNQFVPLQNGVSHMGPAGVMSHPGHFMGGFNQNFNPLAVFAAQGMNSVQNMNGMNPSQLPGQLFSPNGMGMPQFMNQNVAMPNGQFCFQNPMQNMNQFVQMQMPNYPQPQVRSGNINVCQNQVAQGMGPQNPMVVANQQFGMMHPNGLMQPANQDERKFVPPTVDGKQTATSSQQLQGNSSVQLPLGPVPPQQTQNFRPFCTNSQGDPKIAHGNNNLHNNWTNSQNKKFTRNQKGDASTTGAQKSQFHHMNNPKNKFGFHTAHGRKGYNNSGARNSGVANPSNQTGMERRRPLCLNYTEQEIKQWREERRKNYPSQVNVEKKLTEKLAEADREAKIRRQRLKEILAKQAELGCEVAEIPSSYLSDSEKQVNGREENKRFLNKKDRFQNKFNKRGRSRQNDRFGKRQRFADADSCNNAHDQNNQCPERRGSTENGSSTRPAMSKKEPTLLEKLLSADIKRDKSYLLQVFRFMVMNSFLKDWPEKPLRFPSVIVRETEFEAVAMDDKSSFSASSVAIPNTATEENDDLNDNDNPTVEVNRDVQIQEIGNIARLKGSTIGREIVAEVPEEEEGEIID